MAVNSSFTFPGERYNHAALIACVALTSLRTAFCQNVPAGNESFTFEPSIADVGLSLFSDEATRFPSVTNFSAFAELQDGSTPATVESDPAANLAKKLANPISDLISLPFQFNYDEGFGPADAGRYTLNIQPVIPISINEDWNLISRTIVPTVYQESLATGIDSEFGLGDTLQSFFLSPKNPVNGWIVGAGPVFLFPTATDPLLGSENVGIGPTLVALRQEKGWTCGGLVNHIWSVYNDDGREEVNATFLQPFIAYTWPTATTLTLNTEATYDWNAEQWNVPINVMLSQVLKIGDQPVSIQFGPRFYAESPDGGPEWGLRLNITLLFPR